MGLTKKDLEFAAEKNAEITDELDRAVVTDFLCGFLPVYSPFFDEEKYRQYVENKVRENRRETYGD